MEKLIKFKKYLVSRIGIQEFIHFRSALKDPNSSTITDFQNISIIHYSALPQELFEHFSIYPECITDTECFLAFYNGSPAGCFLLNLDGRGKLLEIFDYDFSLGEGHIYGHHLYVKNEFRGRGIAKLLYTSAIREYKNNHDYIDVIVKANDFSGKQTARRTGFSEIKRIELVRFFGFKRVLALDGWINDVFFRIALACLKPIREFFKLAVVPLKKLLELREGLYLNAYEVRDRGLRIIFFSKKLYERLLLDKLLGYDYQLHLIGRFSRKSLEKEFTFASKESDIVIFDGNYSVAHRFLSKIEGITFMPHWVDQVNSSFTGLQDFAKSKNRNAYEDIRVIKKRGFEYVFSRSPELLLFFYENMYLPFTSNRFQQGRTSSGFKEIEQSFKKGGLALIRLNGKFLSGTVVELVNKTIHPMYSGVLNGDITLLKEDVSIALYYYYFLLANERGFSCVDFGFSRPFLNDGVLRYKSKWNSHLEFDPRQINIFAYKISRVSPAIKKFLLSNPLITVEGDKLVGNIFLEDGTDVNGEELSHKYLFNGLSSIRFVRLEKPAGEDASSTQWADGCLADQQARPLQKKQSEQDSTS